MAARYEFFDHTADLGIRLFADTQIELVPVAAEAFYAAIGELEPARGSMDEARTFDLAGEDAAGLLRDFLVELLIAFETRQVIACEIAPRQFDDRRLVADAALCPIDAERSVFLREVKAITYHALELARTEKGFRATMIVDI